VANRANATEDTELSLNASQKRQELEDASVNSPDKCQRSAASVLPDAVAVSPPSPQLTFFSARRDGYLAQKERQKAEKTKLDAEEAEVKAKKAKLDAEIQSEAEAFIQSLLDERGSLRKLIESLKNEVVELKGLNRGFQKTFQNEFRKQKELERKNAELRDSLQKVQSENAELKD
jgi:chromosome segregation ATPase